MRISDWSSDVCSSDLADPSTAFDRAANIAAGGRAVIHADEDRPGWSVRRPTGAGPCDPRRAGEPLWPGHAAGRAVRPLYWRAGPGAFRRYHSLVGLIHPLARGPWRSSLLTICGAGARS